MNRLLISSITAWVAVALPAGAQEMTRRANVGNGNPESGKCTIEVVVDGTAEVTINGDTATLRNLQGQLPQWRRFECTSRMPNNPANFRFQGIDGRGRVDLVRDPRNGGVAVVRIEDRDGGAEGYTFDLIWGGFDRGGYPNYTSNRPDYRPDYDRPGGQSGWTGGIWRGGGIWGTGEYAARQAVRVCRDEVRQMANQRFGPGNVTFYDLRLQDQPDRRDWVMGAFSLRGRRHDFACSVNFDNGNVRWANIDAPGGRWESNSADRWVGGGYNAREAIQNCRSEVFNRLRSRGMGNIDFSRLGVDNNPGRNDWVTGEVSGDRGRYPEYYRFACQVNMDNGNVRSVNINRQ
jgi:hypothetical protein